MSADPTPAERCPSCGPGYRYGDDGCRHTPPAVPDTGDVETLAEAKALIRDLGDMACIGCRKKTCPACGLAAEVTSRVHVLLTEVRRETAERVLAGLTDDEASLVDFEMGEHMYRHSISNNINSMGCDVWCRTNGLRRAINKVLSTRIAREDGAR